MSLVKFFGLVILVLQASVLQAQLPYFPHYNTVQGLAGNQCYDLLQDSKGFVWVATASGVSRFDGSTFQNFSVESGLPDNEILKIQEDSKGRIWFMALNGSISFMHQDTIYNAKNSALLSKIYSKSAVNSLFEDKQHRIWLGFTDDKVMCLQNNEVFEYRAEKINNAIFTQDSLGQIWAHNVFASFRFKNSKFENVPEKITPINNKSMAVNETGFLLLDSRGELYAYKDQKHQLFSLIPNQFFNVSSRLFYTPSNVGEGFWITKNNGIRYFNKYVLTPNYLANVKVYKVVKAKDGSYWFATSDGVFLLPNTDERYFIFNKEENNLFSNRVKSVFIDAYHRTWVGYDEGVVDVFENNKFIKRYQVGKDQEINEVKQFCMDTTSTQRLYMITDFGLYYIAMQEKLPKAFDSLSLENIGMFALKQLAISEQYIAIATSAGVYLIRKNVASKFPIQTSDLVFSHNGRAFDVFLDQNEHLWFSDVEGLAEFANGKLTNHFGENILLNKRIDDIQAYKDGTIILATNGYGLLFYDKGKLTNQLTHINGLSSNICQKIFVQNDTIWIQTAKGCNYILKKGNQYTIRNLNFIHPEISDNLTDLCINNQFNLGYLASDKGLIVFVNRNQKKSASPSPKVYVQSVMSNSSVVNHRKPIVLNVFKTNLTVQFAAISFNNTSTGYRYKLNKENWSETNTTKIEIASLLPGKYKLLICANRNNGEWSSPAVLNFTIQSPFWWRWWFVGLVFIVILALIFFAVKCFVKYQRNKEENELITQNKILVLEQQALQAMMNPHFVFNIMNAIQHFINTNDNAGANRMLTGFARLIRKNLDICNKSKISIQEEVAYLELYLKLEKMRFGDKLQYQIEIDSNIDAEEVHIPSMILQPFVENSLWHGIMPKSEGGKIEISIVKLTNDRKIAVKIKDDGVGIENSLRNKSGGHVSKGMAITKERISLIAQIEKKNISLQMQQLGSKGTQVVLEFQY